ncbi:tetratricopeptide repeat protein [Iocasia frigidifontis]|uniref:hypothetical protein n=1 Tax=Iocasia fonsfrigidae TaxID=2682810 RepID=UPI001E51A333|nr:hypothetical protein [Iocasia fonsfrigidae]
MNQKDVSKNTSSSPTKVNLDDNEDTPLHGQITAFQNLIDEGEVHTALKQFLKLKEKEWSDASLSEKYRILVGIASAKLQIGNQEEAGQLLLDAYNEYPEHKNANKNKAAGHLLIGDDRKAEEISYKIMIEKEDPYAASVFIQSQISNNGCANPLSQVPEGLHESEDVFNAYIHFLRMRDNSNWLEYAKKAYLITICRFTLNKIFNGMLGFTEAEVKNIIKLFQINDEESELLTKLRKTIMVICLVKMESKQFIILI